ncbi:MAG: hypothetical protein IPH06_08660 [Alphaproteobacteria bacterium]|nr:hypothetical protein [Alphaproteobacteria bacterium]QQS58071.1 MAG: hypothetical protein IPN28_04420 [Alphaproteobacteria bacterium]
MKAKSPIILGLVSIPVLAVLLLWLGKEYPWGTWRYRVTVEIVTPEGIKTGSAVRELRVHTEPGFLGVRKQGVAHLVGEAVVIDLGERGVLFALLSEDDIFHAFPYNNGAGVKAPDGIRFYNGLRPDITGQLPREHYPRFAIFEDMQDPNTLRLIYGSHLDLETRKSVYVDEVAELLGYGVRIRNVTIEITDDAVTWGVENVIPHFGPVPRPIGFDDFVRKGR